MIKVEKKTGIYYNEAHEIRIRQRFGKVLLLVDGAVLEFGTPAAFKLGWDIACKSGELLPSEYLSIKINGKEIKLLSEAGLKVGGAILRKTDDADDFQIMRA